MAGTVTRFEVAGIVCDVQTELQNGQYKTTIFQSGTVVFSIEHDSDSPPNVASVHHLHRLQRDAIVSYLRQR